MWWRRGVLLTVVAATLAACGFQPMYRSGGSGPVSAALAEVRIENIPDRLGQMLHNELLDLMQPQGEAAATAYSLRVTVSEGREELAVERTKFATRANFRVNATFTLTRRAQGNRPSQAVLVGTAEGISSFNIQPAQPYATLEAEMDARERAVREAATKIHTRIAAHFAEVAATAR